MAKEQVSDKLAIVAGDVTMDWNLARDARSPAGPSGLGSHDTVQACWQRGGAPAASLTPLTGRLPRLLQRLLPA